MGKDISRKVQNRMLTLLAVAFFLPGLFVKCASIQAPMGGPVDTLPPVVIAMLPPHGTVNFNYKKINIMFDEYVKIADLQKEFFTSPFMGRKPSVSLRGRGIQIDLQDTLRENTTYALNFGSSIRDNNEDNPLHGFRYVFSTGDHIDSMIMSGYTVDGYRGDSVGNVFIMFYPDEEYPLNPEYDSTLFNIKAHVVARSFPNGIFLAQNLKPVNYRIYALHDVNNNQNYEPGTDRVAFLDSVYNPATMPAFSMRFDSIRQYLVPQPQTLFRMFMDEGFKRQYLVASRRPMKQKLELHFNAPDPIVDTLRLEGIDEEDIIREYPTAGRDTIFLWLNVPADELADTIKGRVSYMRHDSLNVLTNVGVDIKLGWFEREETRDEKRAREELEKSIEEAISKGETPPHRPNPFKYQVKASAELNPENNIEFEFEYPMLSIDSANIELVRVDGDRLLDVYFGFEQDSVAIRRWTLSAPWIAGENYRLTIPAGAFINIARQQNDTLRSEFKIATPDKFATLTVNIKGKTPESQYTLQVISISGSLIKEIRHAATGKHIFQYLNPGAVKLRVVEDMNGNGVWDRGDLIRRIQPERVEIFVNDNGEEEITTKMNWEQGIDIDMSQMFAPITMERLIQRIEAREAARLRRSRQNQEGSLPGGRQSKTRQQRSEPSSGSGSSSGGILGGGSLPSLQDIRR